MNIISNDKISLVDCMPAVTVRGKKVMAGGKLWQELRNKIDSAEDKLITLDTLMDEQGETAELVAEYSAVFAEKEELMQAFDLVMWYYDNFTKIDALQEMFPNITL